MAKKPRKKNRASGHHHRVARSHNRKRNAGRRRSGGTKISLATAMRMMGKRKSRHHRARRSSNPFATSISLTRPTGIVIAAGGVLVGVALNKFIVNMLPASITSNTLYATLAAFAVAGAEWWALSLVSPEFGAAAGLGGIAEAGSIALTNFMPSVGNTLALSGRLGDFVSGRFVVPQNPILDAATGLPSSQVRTVSAYPKPYAAAA